MSANQQLLDDAIRHAIHSQRYGRGLAKRIVTLLNSADADLAARLVARLAAINDLGPATTQRMGEILESIRGINAAVYARIASGLTADLTELAAYEIDWQAQSLRKAITVNIAIRIPPPQFLETLVTTTPVDGYLLKPWVDQMSTNRLSRIERELRIGMVSGDTIDGLTKRVRSVLPISRRSAETLAITANSSIANAARQTVFDQNEELISGVEWLATLDSRTSPVCQSRDGKFYRQGEAHPTPPAHPRCRSLLVPVTKSFRELGLDAEDYTPEQRASMDGAVPASRSYGEWLKGQAPSRQEEILGSTRAKMFRDGKVKFADLYRDDGSYRSLDELRKRERG